MVTIIHLFRDQIYDTKIVKNCDKIRWSQNIHHFVTKLLDIKIMIIVRKLNGHMIIGPDRPVEPVRP